MGYRIPRTGALGLENGDLVARTHDGREVGRFFVGSQCVVYEGELTLYQDADPPKLRLVSSYDNWRGGLGIVSFNVLSDGEGRQEEVAWLRGSLSEDSTGPGDYRGQVDCYVRGAGDAEPRPAWLVSDAYTLAEYGIAKMRTYVRDVYAGLWKWS